MLGPDAPNGTRKYKCLPCDRDYNRDLNRGNGTMPFQPAEHGPLSGYSRHVDPRLKDRTADWPREPCRAVWAEYNREYMTQRRRANGVPRMGDKGRADRALIIQILEERGECTVNELAAAIGKSRSATSQLLVRLRADGLVLPARPGSKRPVQLTVD